MFASSFYRGIAKQFVFSLGWAEILEGEVALVYLAVDDEVVHRQRAENEACVERVEVVLLEGWSFVGEPSRALFQYGWLQSRVATSQLACIFAL
jgi:hypothetical protein